MAKKTTRSARKTETPAPEAPTPAKPRARAKSSTTRTRKSTASDKVVAETVPVDTIVVVEETVTVEARWEPTDEDIRVRAYHRFLERGGSHGSEFDDWLEAKRDLLRSR